MVDERARMHGECHLRVLYTSNTKFVNTRVYKWEEAGESGCMRNGEEYRVRSSEELLLNTPTKREYYF